jgi:hypothetical protein
MTTIKACFRCKEQKSIDQFSYKWDPCEEFKIPIAVCKACKRIDRVNAYAKKMGKTRDQIVKGKIDKTTRYIDGRECRYCKKHLLRDKFYVYGSYTKLTDVCKKCSIWLNRINARQVKMEFLIAYGKACVCCGEDKIDLLTIEHIKDKGHELIYGRTTPSLMHRLKRLGWPVGYETRCYNCNLSTRFGKPCVHNVEEHEKYEREFKRIVNLSTDIRRSNYILIERRYKGNMKNKDFSVRGI